MHFFSRSALMHTWIVALLLPTAAVAQQNTPATSKNVVPVSNIAQRDVSLKRLLPNFLEDQKRIWLFPLHSLAPNTITPVASFIGMTSSLVYADRYDTQFFRTTASFTQFNKVFSSTKTEIGTAVVPAAFYVIGLSRKDSYTAQTGLLAAEALADAEVVDFATKAASRRLRPEAVPVHGDFEDTWFDTSVSQSGFVSGHAFAAFSVATVITRRYPEHRWVRYSAYGLAGLVAFSRVTLTKHFPSDVFAGAVLGYAVSRYAVLRP